MLFTICKYPNCNNIIHETENLCEECFRKVVNYEVALDKWLEDNHPNIYLDDVISWYAKCVRSKCIRDCLDDNEICDCCPHLLTTNYKSFQIENFLMPTVDFLNELTSRHSTD